MIHPICALLEARILLEVEWVHIDDELLKPRFRQVQEYSHIHIDDELLKTRFI